MLPCHNENTGTWFNIVFLPRHFVNLKYNGVSSYKTTKFILVLRSGASGLKVVHTVVRFLFLNEYVVLCLNMFVYMWICKIKTYI